MSTACMVAGAIIVLAVAQLFLQKDAPVYAVPVSIAAVIFLLLQLSGAVQSLLQEALGDGWQEAAKQPFSQRLTCLTGVQLGDQALRTCCILENATMLPPLSMEMAKTIAENPTALALDAFRYQVEEDGSVTASYLLRARGEVRFVRTYAPDEQL